MNALGIRCSRSSPLTMAQIEQIDFMRTDMGMSARQIAADLNLSRKKVNAAVKEIRAKERGDIAEVVLPVRMFKEQKSKYTPEQKEEWIVRRLSGENVKSIAASVGAKESYVCQTIAKLMGRR